MHRIQQSGEIEVSIANVQTKPISLFAMLRNKKSFTIVSPENAGINGFARLTATSARLTSDDDVFCKTYFCFQSAILGLSIAKKSKLELTLANWNLEFQLTEVKLTDIAIITFAIMTQNNLVFLSKSKEYRMLF